MTFGVIGSSFFGNVSNCWLNSYGKFGGATRRRFFAICEKLEGGGGRITAPPPAVRGLSEMQMCYLLVKPVTLSTLLRPQLLARMAKPHQDTSLSRIIKSFADVDLLFTSTETQY